MSTQIFDLYNPVTDEIFRVMDNDGNIIHPELKPDMDDAGVLKAYKNMLFCRTADQMIMSYQRQGRIYTYPPNYGQEAIAGAAGELMQDDDWLVPAFREMGAYLAKGATLKEIFLYFMGYEDGSKFQNAKNMLPMSVPIASQFPHAAGIGYALKIKKLKDVVWAFVGDGGTSEGDFHEGVNFAAVWKAPVIFIVQNNQYGISTPWKVQTASVNLAVKAIAYGIKGIKVDGNDFFAMYETLKQAAQLAKEGIGPILIEALTYRKGAHTTSDDPTKYRTKEEEEEWDCTDPLKRLKAYLTYKKIWTNKEEEIIVEDYKKEIDRQFTEAENYPAYKLNDVFNYMYVDKPDDLKIQQVEYENFLQWKEARQ